MAMQYEQPALRRLVALCRELQSASGEEPFFLSIRTAAELLDVDPATAARWLRGLCTDKIIQLVERGELGKHKASRYRYIAETISAKGTA